MAPVLNDCWNSIGVRGDRSCSRLEEIIHCRNCADYSVAGAQLLNQALSRASRHEWTQHFAQPKILPGADRVSALLFRIGHEWLALPAQVIQEVAEHRPVHSLPHRTRRPGNLVVGLVNIRGQLLLCVSAARLLNIEPLASSAQHLASRMLVTNCNGHRLAFPVAEVHGIHRYGAGELKAVPATLVPDQTANVQFGIRHSAFCKGILPWRDKSVGCLEAESFFAALNRSLA